MMLKNQSLLKSGETLLKFKFTLYKIHCPQIYGANFAFHIMLTPVCASGLKDVFDEAILAVLCPPAREKGRCQLL